MTLLPNIKYDFFSNSIASLLLPSNYQLMPNVDDLFELDFALGEIGLLSPEEIIHRSAYISKINGKETNHYKIGLATSMDIYSNKSIRTRSFFTKGRFSTGYAVHGLFPYRGKFHAQLIKGIINVIGIKPGDTLLDPMMGSGTACIEAQMMGINTIGYDMSPFCYLMASAKSFAISNKTNALEKALNSIDGTVDSIERNRGSIDNRGSYHEGSGLVLLAYLDAMGYARRVIDKKIKDKFPEVLSRYINTINHFWLIKNSLDLKIGNGVYGVGDARNLSLNINTIDGVITSPPYSFAIDYIENDLPQLEFLGVDIGELRKSLIGLRGGYNKQNRIEIYLEDLNVLFSEMSRVLKFGKFFVIIIGSNEIQTGGIRFEEKCIDFAPKNGFELLKIIKKPIRGIQNSMTEEYILFFKKIR